MISRNKQQNNIANEKRSLIPLRLRIPIWKIDFCSLFLRLSMFLRLSVLPRYFSIT